MSKLKLLMTVILLTCFVFAVLFSAAYALTEGWLLIGQSIFTNQSDHDTIIVSAKKGWLSAMKIAVFKEPVEFRNVKVYFYKGGIQDININRVINAGEESEVMEFVEKRRIIQKIELWYNANSLPNKKALVKIYGLKE